MLRVIFLSLMYIFAGWGLYYIFHGYYLWEVSGLVGLKSIIWEYLYAFILFFVAFALKTAADVAGSSDARSKGFERPASMAGTRSLRTEYRSLLAKYKRSASVEDLYRLGVLEIKLQNKKLGHGEAGLAFFLPITVSFSREKSGTKLTTNVPHFSGLTEVEKEIVKCLYLAIAGDSDRFFSFLETPIGAKLLEPLTILHSTAYQQKARSQLSLIKRVFSKRKSITPAKRDFFDFTTMSGLELEMYAACQIAEIISEAGALPSPAESAEILRDISKARSLFLARASRLNNAEVWDQASSWFGGLPRLGAQEWPRSVKDNLPLVFLAQINLENANRNLLVDQVPDSGWLAFFIGHGSLECKVIHVQTRELPPLSQAPADASPTWGWYGNSGPLPDILTSPDRAFSFPYFPMELLPRASGEGEATNAALSEFDRLVPSREYFMSARQVHEMASVEPEYFGHTVQHYAAKMMLAAMEADSVIARLKDRRNRLQDGELTDHKRNKITETEELLRKSKLAKNDFLLLCQNFYDWAFQFSKWNSLDAESVKMFREWCSRIQLDQFSELGSKYFHRSHFEELLTPTYLTAMAAPDNVFFKLKKEIQAVLSENYRRPTKYRCHQMFGQGSQVQGNAAMEHMGDHMLLQLAYDDIMGWKFGDMGVFQFWISPSNLNRQKWDKVEVTFEGH